jgi:hypothetical protein
MNLKNKMVSIAVGVLSISLLSFTHAHAEDSSYAVVNSSGVVTNVIVCSAETCGPSGAWAGKMPTDTECPGCSLVLQVAANPTTGAYQGSIFPSADSGKQMTYNEGTFTISDKNTYVSQEVITEIVDSSTVTTTLTATVQGGPTQSFTYEDTVGKDWAQIITSLSMDEIPNATRATVSATEQSRNITKQESVTLEERVTMSALQSVLTENSLSILSGKIAALTRILGNWLIM